MEQIGGYQPPTPGIFAPINPIPGPGVRFMSIGRFSFVRESILSSAFWRVKKSSSDPLS